jgi:hypothetical protein
MNDCEEDEDEDCEPAFVIMGFCDDHSLLLGFHDLGI